MLRRLDIKDQWRSLDKGFWPDDLPSGSRTVVYGHNGSGKSTLSELLLSLAEGTSATSVAWEDENRRRTNVSMGGAGPSTSMAVFTRKWVETNLSAFLGGAGASAIVTLGKEAIDAKEEEARLVEEIGGLRDEAKEAAKQRRVADDKVGKLAREVQDRIVFELREFDYKRFTKHRYSVTKVQEELRKYKGDFPNDNAHADALKRLGEGAPSAVREVTAPPAGVVNDLTSLAGLLAETPTRVAIQALERNPSAQTWVERGVALHEGLDHCLFCAGEIDSDRRDQLARHFDESWLQIRGRARAMLTAVNGERQALADWHAALPATTSLASDLQAVYEGAAQQAKTDVDDRVAALATIETVLDAKAADPSATPEAPDWSVLGTTPSATVLTQAVAEHNNQVRRHAEATAERMQIVLDHLVGSQSEAFRRLEEQAKELAAQSETAERSAELADRRLDEVRQSRFTTKDMADTLTRDLARVYGKDHLSVAVTPDGKSYACRRGDKPGTDLSDGERTTLSLLYFLRKLEDEQVPGLDQAQRIVVIDDPSSSLDREALFATHQWLIDTLKGFGQYIVLTHDFSLLRLFIKSHKNAWGRSMMQIKKGDVEEVRFPKVSFLEMYAAAVDGERRSRVGKLPRVLLNNTSEYGYLFSMVMAGITDSEDHERLFLLPNAARRVLEVFASYKAPHRTDFLQQLEILVEAQEGEPYRDVYDFCNRFSHGEGSESIDVLDARAVHGQIRRCMEFLRAIDSQHFERMCSATGADPTMLP
ncbi:AAA family ATPase [Promicromonospora thailandica]|uniref:Wobble nucleotide-excising tRNase n=1 Tax=Promicromonospora thailandica TaxID=765201 RepID=A0A9X2G384_9MICO|nr:AAA family ATPase [Promicromonospora thailandica]MCP2264643.1 Wobble nucleotide-excising tRNase [Promicromonospora thailandica]BFF20280.1 AAA family ATPase [Promicromonospora thailandica]